MLEKMVAALVTCAGNRKSCMVQVLGEYLILSPCRVFAQITQLHHILVLHTTYTNECAELSVAY